MTAIHTFAICAYKDSPYLETLIDSLKKQTFQGSRILLATSTPSPFLEGVAKRYALPYCINPEQKGIASDWNFALACSETELITIAHQDDVYFPDYAQCIIAAMQNNADATLAFTNYGDLCEGKLYKHRLYLEIKRMLLWAFYLKRSHRSKWMKKSALVFGNAICCPSVTFRQTGEKPICFDNTFSVNLDWAMWLKLAEKPGAFVYIPQMMMAHRIAESMETANAIKDNRRYEEDLRIFEMLWGPKTAKLLMKFYKKAYHYAD